MHVVLGTVSTLSYTFKELTNGNQTECVRAWVPSLVGRRRSSSSIHAAYSDPPACSHPCGLYALTPVNSCTMSAATIMLLRRAATTSTMARMSGPVAARSMCVNLRKSEGAAEDGWFAKQERAALDKLKASLAKKKKPIDEADEKVSPPHRRHPSLHMRSRSPKRPLSTILVLIVRRCVCRGSLRPWA